MNLMIMIMMMMNKIKNKREIPCTLIGVAIPADSYVTQKDAEKKQNYKSVCVWRDNECGA